MEVIGEARRKMVVYMRSVVEAWKEQDGFTGPAPIEVMQLDAIGRNEAGLRRAYVRGRQRSNSPRTADTEHGQKHGSVFHGVMFIGPNENKLRRAQRGRDWRSREVFQSWKRGNKPGRHRLRLLVRLISRESR